VVDGAAAYAVTYAMRPPRLDLPVEDDRRNLRWAEVFEEQGLRDPDDDVLAPFLARPVIVRVERAVAKALIEATEELRDDPELFDDLRRSPQ
jgi:hypothetical protein